MVVYILLAWVAGLAAVIQSGVSRKLAERAGLASALHVSNLIVLIGGVVILTLISATSRSDFADLLRIKLNYRTWSWWFLLPGAMGLFVITVMPFTILRVGALTVFVAMIFGQVLGSLIWDRFAEGMPFDKWRIIGCVLTLAGATMIALNQPAKP